MRLWRVLRAFSLFFLGVFSYVFVKTVVFAPSSEVISIADVEPELLPFTVTSASLQESAGDQCGPDALSVLPKTARDAGCLNCAQYTCNNLLFPPSQGQAEVYKSARQWMKSNPVKLKPDAYFLNATADCASFQRLRGYHLRPANREEAAFPIAFNIIMHKDVAQIERLLRAVYRPQNEYCVHVDAKQPRVVADAMAAIARCFPNIHMVSRAERVTYAGFSRLKADINCMHDLHTQMRTPWRYLINLAGQSFPLRTNHEMVKILKVYNGSNDVEGIFGARILRGRFDNEWIEVNTNTSRPSLKKTGNKNPKPPFDIDIVRGSAYGIFSREFVHFILNDERAKGLLEWSRKTWSPDEHYWSTLHHLYTNPHLKTPGGYPGKPDEKPWLAVFASWGGRDKCEGMWKHGVCVFGVGDLPQLLKRRELFANKFYMDFQPMALDCIEEWLEHKVRCPPSFDDAYYSSLPFVRKNLRPWEHVAHVR